MNMTIIINQMIELFLLMALGYILNKIKIFDLRFNKSLTNFLLCVSTPSLIINSVLNLNEYKPLSEIMQVFIIGIILYAVLPFIGLVINKIIKINEKDNGLYIFMTIFSNVGFMGFAVINSIFSNSEAMFYASIINMVFNIYAFTVGIYVLNIGSENKIAVNLKNIISPAIIASLLSLLIYIFRINVPIVIQNTVGSVGSITTPLAMLLIGSSLATMPLKKVFTDIKLNIYVVIRQLILPIILYPVLALLISNKLILGVTFIIIAMPIANYAVLFATKHDKNIDLASKGVFLSTLLSVIGIPLLVYLFLI